VFRVGEDTSAVQKAGFGSGLLRFVLKQGWEAGGSGETFSELDHGFPRGAQTRQENPAREKRLKKKKTKGKGGLMDRRGVKNLGGTQ